MQTNSLQPSPPGFAKRDKINETQEVSDHHRSKRRRGSVPSPPQLDYNPDHISPQSHPILHTSASAGSNLGPKADRDEADDRLSKRPRLSEVFIQSTETAETSPDKSGVQPDLEEPGYGLCWSRVPSPAQDDSQCRDDNFDPVEYWAREGRWPPNLALQEMEDNSRNTVDSGAQGGILRQKSPLTKRKRSQSESDDGGTSYGTPSRDAKSACYRSAAYDTVLETKNSFMRDDERWEDAASAKDGRDLVDTLLYIATDPTQAKVFSHPTPDTTLFADSRFEKICRKVAGKNEARVVRDILPLIVPPAEILAVYGATHLDKLVESVNQGWDCAQPLVASRPQPDYSVGFSRDAFTQAQLAKLAPYISDGTSSDWESLFMGTRLMHFPFLTCEVKCGNQALTISDRQNAHSMTLAVRGVVELFRLVGREKELDYRILALSISHDDSNVRIYGHYPVVDTGAVKYYRHKIHAYDFTVLKGRDKWAAFRIVRYIYDKWMPSFLETVCSAIDSLKLPAPPAPVPLFEQLREGAQAAPEAQREELE